MTKRIPLQLIAPCGMNCNLCRGYLREKNTCSGCNSSGNKPNYCHRCSIKNCQILQQNKWKYCSSTCEQYPCARLKSLDTRYRAKYAMSMLDNLEYIEKQGIRKFIQKEEKKWIKNNMVYCVHRKEYYAFK